MVGASSRLDELYEPFAEAFIQAFTAHPQTARSYSQAIEWAKAAVRLDERGSRLAGLWFDVSGDYIQKVVTALGRHAELRELMSEGMAARLVCYGVARVACPKFNPEVLPPVYIRRFWSGQRTDARWIDGEPYYVYRGATPDERKRLEPYIEFIEAKLQGRSAELGTRPYGSGQYQTLEEFVGGGQEAAEAYRRTKTRGRLTVAKLVKLMPIEKTAFWGYMSKYGLSWGEYRRRIDPGR